VKLYFIMITLLSVGNVVPIAWVRGSDAQVGEWYGFSPVARHHS
jgi:hypothetical protein